LAYSETQFGIFCLCGLGDTKPTMNLEVDLQFEHNEQQKFLPPV